MKNLNDLKLERNTLSEELDTIKNDTEGKVEEQRSRIDEIATEFNSLSEDIARMEMVERANILELEKVEPEKVEPETETRSLGEGFRDFLTEAIDGKGGLNFRADPWITGTGQVNQTVGGIDILKSPGMAFLSTLGVTFMTGLNGNLILPYMSQNTAEWANEGGDASTASMSQTEITLAARRVTHSQSITRESLAQTNPDLYSTILQELVDGIGQAVADDVFDTTETDAPGQAHITTAGGFTYLDILQMEASIGDYAINTKVATTPAIKAYLKQEAEYGTDRSPIWSDNEVAGFPAFSSSHANTNRLYIGDFSRNVVGQWGGVEVVVDPYGDYAKTGRINLTAIALFDTGQRNPEAIVFTDDVSAAV